jgi:hypothetical protein
MAVLLYQNNVGWTGTLSVPGRSGGLAGAFGASGGGSGVAGIVGTNGSNGAAGFSLALIDVS